MGFQGVRTISANSKIVIEKSADGRNYETAIERAKNIKYNFEFKNNTLLLDNYLTTSIENKFSDQDVDAILYLPENTILYFNNSTKNYLHYRTYDGNIVSRDNVNHYLKILYDDTECLDCPEEDFKLKVNTPKIKIDDSGIEINSEEGHLKIDENGIKAESDDVKLNINSDGVEIESEE